MKALRFVLPFFALWLLSGPVRPAAPDTAGGFYLGGRLGADILQTPTERDRPGAGLLGYDRESFAWAAFGGYRWQISRHWLLGAEAGYADNGHASITYASQNEYEFRSAQVDLLGTVTCMSDGGWCVTGRGGVGRVHQEYVNVRLVSGTADLDSDQTRYLPVAALAAGYHLRQGLEFFVEVRRTFGDDTDTVSSALRSTNPDPPPYLDVLDSVARVDTLSFGLTITIGQKKY